MQPTSMDFRTFCRVKDAEEYMSGPTYRKLQNGQEEAALLEEGGDRCDGHLTASS